MQDRIAKINIRLKEACIPVKLLLRGKSLYVQATFPPKAGESRPKQRQISLGLPASSDGVSEAEFKAFEIGRSLTIGTFKWSDWEAESQAIVTVADWVAKLKPVYLAENSITENTWVESWVRVFNLLPQNEELNAAILLAAVLTTEPNSWTRRQACQKLQRLADFAGVEVNLRKYQGNYGQASQREIEVPSDQEIARVWRSIKNPEWQLIYGLMAAFGIRDHEAFFCHFVTDQGISLLQVTEGKTGARRVQAFYPEWVEQWGLVERMEAPGKPKVNGRKSKGYHDYGDRVGKAFKRQGVPWHPYTLRHAYAIRESVIFGIPVAAAAANMGHDPAVHLKTYNRWLDDAHRHQVYREKVLNQAGRVPVPDGL